MSDKPKAQLYISLFELAQLIDLRRHEAGVQVAELEPSPTWLRYLTNGNYREAVAKDLEDRAREMNEKDKG